MEFLSFFTSNGYIYEIILAFIPLLPLIKWRKGWYFELIPLLALVIVVSHFLYGYIAEWNLFLSSLYYLCVFVYLTFALVILSEDGWLKALFISCCALVFRHIFYILFRLISLLLVLCGADGTLLDFIVYVVVMLTTYTVAYYVFVRKIKKYESTKAGGAGLIAVSAGVFAVAVPVNMYFQRLFVEIGVEYGLPNVVFSLLGAIACFGALYLLFYIRRDEHGREELEAIKAMQESERRQYELFKQSMETLNIKYHDLKYSLSGRNSADAKSKTWAEETEQALDVCGAMQNTGNDALDSVLVEKRFQCDALEIEFESTVLDGKLLSAMEEVDIYTLFGNAMDNAIECLQKVPKEKRLLRVNLNRVNGMAKIQIENYTPRVINMETGIVGSSKKIKGVHGYGVKSIERIVRKYNGIVHYTTEDDIFILVIIFPCGE